MSRSLGLAAAAAAAGGALLLLYRRARRDGDEPVDVTTLPLVEPHHHFVNVDDEFGSFVKGLGAPTYTPETYAEQRAGLNIKKAVHMETLPAGRGGGLAEALWVEGLIASGRADADVAIVASCDLSLPAAEVDAQLAALVARCPHVRGIRYVVDYVAPLSGMKLRPALPLFRYIVDYVAPFDGKNATHVAVSRHGGGRGVDFLRDARHAPAFAAGFARLAAHGLSFDLQCAPEQLEAAAALFARHPDVPVVVDHFGKPRLWAAPIAGPQAHPHVRLNLADWRRGMAALAALPHVRVKLSMLGFAVPGWAADAEKEAALKELVLEVIALFGARRCMFSANWWLNGAMSNSDGKDDVDISMLELYRRYARWVAHLPRADVVRLFAGTAEEFYRI